MSKQPVTEQTASGQAAVNGSSGVEPADEKEFQALAAQWHRETDIHSALSIIRNHPAFQRIIGMGERALPLILRELSKDGDPDWCYALVAITNLNPGPKALNQDSRRQAWLKWGKEKGLIE